jgi:hypothetical protein
MAQNRMGHKPGGGLHSRNVRHSTAPKVEPKAYARNPAAVAQYGAHVGNHRTSFGGSETRYKGEPDTMRRGYQNPVGPTSMALSGPGAGRTVMKSGTQCQTGPVAGPRPAPGRGFDERS